MDTISALIRNVIIQEKSQLEKLEGTINENLVNIIFSLFNTKGKIIGSGIGKTGLIVQKFVSTLLSIKINAIFLHPVDALHGDLGIVSKEDTFIFFSNSGENPEIRVLLPYIRKIGCKILGIVGAEGELTKYSDLNFVYGKVDEAGPLGLVPTSSTIVQLAICDAIAMSLLKLKNLTIDDFVKLHPGGSIGKNYSRVYEIMRKGEQVVAVFFTTKIGEALRKMTKVRAGAVCIIDEKNELLGIFTDGDFRRNSLIHPRILEIEIGTLMTKNPKTVGSDNYVYEALNIMKNYKIDELPVVSNDNKLVGLLDIQDIVRWY
ncbi:MAG: SIS domain-containing protein [Planctomycetota bacterium]